MRKILDERERIELRQHRRLIITETLMFLSVIVLVCFLTLVVMGYSFNLRGLDGSAEVVERTGLVQVASMPSGATIYIDGETSLLFNTNASRAVLAGEHEISLARGGFDGWKKTINVTEGLVYRLNYPRLFKEERETEEVLEFRNHTYDVARMLQLEAKDGVVDTGGIEFVSVSPNNERMVLLMDSGLYLINLNESKPTLKMLEIMNKEGALVPFPNIEVAEWSGNSERLLVKTNGAWVSVNVRDARETVWLNEILVNCAEKQGLKDEASCAKVVVSDIKIENEAGDRLLVLSDKNELFELSVREGKLSEVLLEDVYEFDNDDERVMFLTKAKVETSGEDFATETEVHEEWQLRAWRLGDADTWLVKRLTEFDKEKGLEFRVMRYFQEFYLGVVDGAEFEVYKKTGWPIMDEEMEKVFEEEVDSDIQAMQKRGKGMVFELSGASGQTKVFDIEATKTVDVDTTGCGWVDEFLRYRLQDGRLSVLDYDGLNERVLVQSGVLAKRKVVISGNNRYLYYFVSNGEGEALGEKLVREKIN